MEMELDFQDCSLQHSSMMYATGRQLQRLSCCIPSYGTSSSETELILVQPDVRVLIVSEHHIMDFSTASVTSSQQSHPNLFRNSNSGSPSSASKAFSATRFRAYLGLVAKSLKWI